MRNRLIPFLIGSILFVALWQLEIIYIIATNPLSWGYSFAGLGDFGWQLYTWRDFWFGVIFVLFAFLVVWRDEK